MHEEPVVVARGYEDLTTSVQTSIQPGSQPWLRYVSRTVGEKVLLPGLALVLLVGLWWLATIVFGWQAFIVPNPGEVWDQLVQNRAILPEHVKATFFESVIGFGLAIVVAFPLAIMIAYSRALETTIYPALLALNAIPKIAIAPILIIWMGFGPSPKIAVVVLICFFPIVISTATGLKSTPVEFVELVQSLSASQLQQFWRVRLPASLPFIFVGLKVAISMAVVAAVVGEFVGATKGLGYLVIASGEQAKTSLAFGAIVLLALMSILMFSVVTLVERVMVPWAKSVDRE